MRTRIFDLGVTTQTQSLFYQLMLRNNQTSQESILSAVEECSMIDLVVPMLSNVCQHFAVTESAILSQPPNNFIFK